MNIRKSTVAASFALALVPMVSLASAPHHWWMLEGQNDTCKNPLTLPDPFHTPYAMRNWLRQNGSANTTIHHLPGNLGLVVTFSGYMLPSQRSKSDFVFFSTERGCQYGIEYLKQHGLAPNLNELR